MIEIMPGLSLPEAEISFTATRSGGPGGQNVNKVSSKVTLAFDVAHSAVLSEEQKRKVVEKLGRRVNKEGTLQVVSQRTRSQELNRADAVNRFAELVREALTPEPVRVDTRVPRTEKRKRLEEKKKRALTKHTRSRQGWD